MEPRTYPMSFEQESIWLNDQYQQGVSRYLESWVHRLRGPVDIVAVETALTGIVARHEALRSRLVLVGTMPRQIVVPPPRVPVDVRRITADQCATALTDAVTRQTDLGEPPLLRATLLLIAADGAPAPGPDDREHADRGDERDRAHAGEDPERATDESVLAVAIHHAVIDGWCFSLLDREFSELYRAAVEGGRPGSPTCRSSPGRTPSGSAAPVPRTAPNWSSTGGPNWRARPASRPSRPTAPGRRRSATTAAGPSSPSTPPPGNGYAASPPGCGPPASSCWPPR